MKTLCLDAYAGAAIGLRDELARLPRLHPRATMTAVNVRSAIGVRIAKPCRSAADDVELSMVHGTVMG